MLSSANERPHATLRARRANDDDFSKRTYTKNKIYTEGLNASRFDQL